jgi:hypothetical protein
MTAPDALHPLPPELRPMVEVVIYASHRKGAWQAVALLEANPYRREGPRLPWEERARLRPAVDAWLKQRFGPAAGDPAAALSMEAEARQTLAMLLAEAEAPDVWDAIHAVQNVAPDLPEPHIARGPNRAHPFNSRGVEQVRKARATLQKVKRLETQAQQAAATDQNAVPAYVYGYSETEHYDGDTYPAAHYRWRILRETKQFLFVDPSSDCINYGMEGWSCNHAHVDGLGRGSVRLPRDLSAVDYAARSRLRGGWRISGMTRDREQLPPLTAAGPVVRHACDGDLEALGLTATAAPTLREVKAAYRRKARTAHPDGGGSADGFRLLTAAYERLCQRLQRQGVAA